MRVICTQEEFYESYTEGLLEVDLLAEKVKIGLFISKRLNEKLKELIAKK